MKRKTEAEMFKADVAKVARTAIRLKHSLKADHELNSVLPDLESRIDAAVVGGDKVTIDYRDLFGTAIEGGEDVNGNS